MTILLILAALAFAPLAGMVCLKMYRGMCRYRRDLKMIHDQATILPDNLPPGYGRLFNERIVEYPWALSCLPTGESTILDAGSTLNHESILRHPRLASKKTTIMTLAPEHNCFWKQGISYVFGDLCNTNFRDGHFDFIVSLSVIEHIGMDNRRYGAESNGSNPQAYLDAITELRRILKPGGTMLVTVPFGKYSNRGWFQVFDAAMINRIIECFRPSAHIIEYFKYDDGWHRSTQSEASGALYFDSLTDQPWPGCPVAAGAIACLRLQK